MRTLKLTPPKLAFVLGTRAALAAGMGLLVSPKLPPQARRMAGIGLVALGVITTIPAVRTLVAAS